MKSTFLVIIGLSFNLSLFRASGSGDDRPDSFQLPNEQSRNKTILGEQEDEELPYSPDLRATKRISGGVSAKDIYLPSMVSLRRSRTYEHYCGGSIISRRWVITAAHCLTKHDGSPILIVAGSKYLGRYGYSYKSSYYVAHPLFEDTTSIGNDVGLLYTDSPIQFSRDVQPIQLPKTPVPAYTGRVTGLVAGWGYTDTTRRYSSVLQHLYLRLIPIADCQSRFAYERTTIRTSQLCAMHSYGHGTCTADSGGPLIVDNVIVGVLSFSSKKGCATGAPEVYTNVWSFMTWIRGTMVAQKLWEYFNQTSSSIR